MTDSPLSDRMERLLLPLDRIAAMLRELPLFADLPPDAHREIARWVKVYKFGPGMEILRADRVDESHNFLYLVVEGRLLQSGEDSEGVPWLERTLTKGDVFGRYSVLFDRPHETNVRSEEAGILITIEAHYVSHLLQRWPALWQKLIPEERIRRLRSIPLYSALPDDHIRRLADHIVEKRLGIDQEHIRNPDDEPHVWVVAEGQVVLAPVAAAAIPSLFDAPVNAIATVGHPFVDGEIPITRLTPRKARAVAETVLYGLPASKFQALVDRFEVPGEQFGSEILRYLRVPDIPRHLAGVHVMDRLPDHWLQAMRGFVAWIYTPRTQTVLRQGEFGRALYILTEGEAILRAVDEQGRRRPRSYLFPGGQVGLRALLRGSEHDVTVEATQPSYWLRLSRDDLDRFDQYIARKEGAKRYGRLRRAWAYSVGWIQAAMRGEPFDPCQRVWCSVWERIGGVSVAQEKTREERTWKEADEKILWEDRAHLFFFLRRLVPPLALFSLLLSIALTYVFAPIPAVVRGLLVSLTAVTGLVLLYIVVDYYNDFYALTDRRIIHRDRVFLIREEWEEIPLHRVQDAILQQSFLGRILHYGTVVVQSAAMGGSITMRHIPHPRRVQERILAECSRARSRWLARRKEHLRSELQRRLFNVMHAAWPQVATGSQHLVETVSRKGKRPRPRRGSWLARLLSLWPTPTPQSGKHPLPWWPHTRWRFGNTLYWRKHHLNLLRQISGPTLVGFLLLVAFIIISGTGIPPIQLQPQRNPAIIMAFLVALLVVAGWFVWQYDEWRNDLYVLTETHIIDIEKTPFFFREERRIAPLNQVQTVQFVKGNIIAQMFNYGNVVIKTAAAGGDLTFDFVPDPRGVAREIQRYVEEFRRRQEEQELEREQRIVADGLEIYDELTGWRRPPGERGWSRTDF